ncbi:MAG: enoyl-CoA hydratase/isomerase family protein [Rhodopirellula sp.]|nr:enoyl-CoA hydratase/isomerase family protein [Rhodopirellula sp.]
MDTQVTLTTDGPVARVQLSGEKGVQLLGAGTRQRLHGVLEEIEQLPEINVVVFQAEGRTFIAGADINELRSLNAETGFENSQQGQALMNRVAALSATTIAAIHAACAGGGTELALACDMRVAAEDAVIGLPETRIGVLPGWGGTVRATRLLGSAVARRLILTGELVTAATALQLGLVDQVVSAEEFRDVVDARVNLVASRGPHARAAAKNLIAQFEGPDVEAQFQAESRAFAECYPTGEPELGMSAFLGKIDVNWASLRTP